LLSTTWRKTEKEESLRAEGREKGKRLTPLDPRPALSQGGEMKAFAKQRRIIEKRKIMKQRENRKN